MSHICPVCKGKKRIGLLRRTCLRCLGRGYVENPPSCNQSQSQQPFFEDGIISIPFADTEKHHVHEESVVGHGGEFGGGGASAHWDSPQAVQSSSDNSSGSSGDSGGSSGGD